MSVPTPLLSHRLWWGPEDSKGDILLLNGGMMTYPTWSPVVERLLPDGYRVLGCDFRGQLLSPPEVDSIGHTQLDAHVPDVVRLLDALELERVHVMGTSFGGMVGLLLASHHRERVASLSMVTSVDRSPDGMGESSRQMQRLVREVLTGESIERFHDALLDDFYSPAYRVRHAEKISERAGQIAALPASWYRGLLGILKSIEEFDLSAEVPRITCPMWVVHAALDEVMPLARAQWLAGAVPDAELVIHPSSGHALVVEDPQWLADTYRSFLARLDEACRLTDETSRLT